MTDRRQYQQEYRQRQKEKLRKLKETKPGQSIRENPDYDEIIAYHQRKVNFISEIGKSTLLQSVKMNAIIL